MLLFCLGCFQCSWVAELGMFFDKFSFAGVVFS